MKESMSCNVQRVAADIWVSLRFPRRSVTTHISPLPSTIRKHVHEPWDSSKRLSVARLVAISPVTQFQATYPKLKMQGHTTPCPAPVYHELEMDPQVRRLLKRTYAIAGKSKKNWWDNWQWWVRTDLSNLSTAAFDFEGEDLSRHTD